jgi:toxin ParE1/3/4
MSLPVRFSPEAIADMQAMYDYIEPRGGKAVAAAYISRIYQYCLDMGMFPERGIKRDGSLDRFAFRRLQTSGNDCD